MQFIHCGSLIPFGYRLVAQIEETPLHNKILVFKNRDTLAVVIRGTVSETNSWLENIHFLQIPAQGILFRNGEQFPYKFSEQPGASVHSGFALAMSYFWTELSSIITNQIRQGVTKINIAGHSQGGALAQLAQSALLELLPSNIEVKSYAFGSPSIGNNAFAADFNQRFTSKNSAFRFINTLDPVVYMPIINYNIPLSKIGINGTLDLEILTDLLQLGAIFIPEDYKSYAQKASELAQEFRTSRLGTIEFPEYAPSNFFAETGKTIEINNPYDSQSGKDLGGNLIGLISSKLKLDLSFEQHRNFSYYQYIFDYFGGNHPRRLFTKQLDTE